MKNYFEELAKECPNLNKGTVELLIGMGIPTHECEKCGKGVHPKVAMEMNGLLLCGECWLNSFGCSMCSSVMTEDETHIVEGVFYCDDCYEGLTECRDCGTRTQDVTEITLHRNRRSIVRNIFLCDDCLNSYFQCRDCDKWFEEDDAAPNNLCQTCYEESYTNCEECGDTIHIEQSYYDEYEEQTLCSSCYNDINTIHDDNPDIEVQRINHDDHPFAIGMELEFECHNNRKDICQYVKKKLYPLFWCKMDGSLSSNNGLEIPCQPMSWEYYQNKGRDQIGKLVDHLSSEGCTAWKTNAGIHISLDKDGFNTPHTYRFLKFFYENPEFIFRISRRSRYDFEKWCDCKNLDRKGLAQKFKEEYKSSGGNKYEAVNLNHSSHYEIRIFAGTLKKSSIFANIEFCRGVYEYTRDAKTKDVSVKGFEKYVQQFQDRFENLINLYLPHLIKI